jgi:hypothetical protein
VGRLKDKFQTILCGSLTDHLYIESMKLLHHLLDKKFLTFISGSGAWILDEAVAGGGFT